MKIFKHMAFIAAVTLMTSAGYAAATEPNHSHEAAQEAVAAEVAPTAAQETKHEAAAEAVNPLIEEMRQLDGVFRDIVSGVSLGDGKAVHAAIEKMHGTMEKTQEAVHEGHVKVPRNANRIKEFVALDKEFHGNLEKLAHAAHANNQQKMLGLTKKLMDGCVKCHSVFR